MHTLLHLRTKPYPPQPALLTSLLLAILLLANTQARANDHNANAYQMPNCTAPVLNPVQYNCDGSVTLSWAAAPGAVTYSVDIERNGMPILDHTTTTADTFLTIVSGTLEPGVDYDLAVTSQCSEQNAAATQGIIDGSQIRNQLPSLQVMGTTGTSCPDAADGSVVLAVDDEGCGATYNVTVDGAVQPTTSGNFVTFNNLAVGNYTATITLDDPRDM